MTFSTKAHAVSATIAIAKPTRTADGDAAGPDKRLPPPRPTRCTARLRQIGESVGRRLNAELHQPADRQQHPQVPEPADQQVGIFPSPNRGRDRDPG